jgi:cellulose synthase/poly-beta-1,6-N-acetylglucosamine synthase-like glycosyltransferase
MKLATIGQRLHEGIDEAGWERPGLDRLASALLGGPRPQAARVRPIASTRTRTALVSVIIPCYNYGRFLPGAVDSALSQEGVEVEVIVVDDASTDASAAVAERLAAGDSRVTAVRNPTNLGHVRTFNRGYERAGGEFIVRLDADDLLTPGCLARAVALFDAYPGVGLVYGHPRHFTSELPPLARTGTVSWTVWDGDAWVRERCLQGVNCITTPEAVIRAEVMASVGALNTRLRFAQDMEMWLRVAAASDVGRVNAADQALHRDHATSMSVTDGAGLLVDLEERRTVFSEVIRTMGDRLPDAAELDRTWRESLAREALAQTEYHWVRGRHDKDQAAAVRDLTLSVLAETPGTRDGVPALAARWERFDQRVADHRPTWSATAPVARVVWGRLRDEALYLRWSRTGV